MKKLFYEISYTTSEPTGFAWAGGFGPLLDGMPFFHESQLEREKAFWKVNPKPPGIIIDPGGWRWPDFLGHGGGYPSFFVSKRIVDSLRALTESVSRVTEMPIAKIEGKLLKIIPAPKYFVIETRAGIEVDYEASGVPVDASGKLILPAPNPFPRYKLKYSSWNGADLFAYTTFLGPPYTTLICTDKIRELARKKAWTNVRFQPMEAI